MLKTIASAELAPKMLEVDNNEVVKVSGKTNKTFKNLFKPKKSKDDKSGNLTHITITKAIKNLHS